MTGANGGLAHTGFLSPGDEALATYEQGRCDGIVLEAQLANPWISGLQAPGDHIVLPEVIGNAQGAGTSHADGGPVQPEGDYSVTGTNPDGSSYNGNAKINKIGDQYTVVWNIQDKTYSGIGRLHDGTLSVDWGKEQPIVYSIERNGVLVGQWANGAATDILSPAGAAVDAQPGLQAGLGGGGTGVGVVTPECRAIFQQCASTTHCGVWLGILSSEASNFTQPLGSCGVDCANTLKSNIARTTTVTVSGPDMFQPINPDMVHGCVGFRPDAGGTSQGAQCLAALLGPSYRADVNGGCSDSGIGYNVVLP